MPALRTPIECETQVSLLVTPGACWREHITNNKASDLFLAAVGTWTVQSNNEEAQCTLLPACDELMALGCTARRCKWTR